jgi:ribosome biogenesis protein BMS1
MWCTLIVHYVWLSIEEIFGDFEDLETGEVHHGTTAVEKEDESEDESGDERGDEAENKEGKDKQEIEERIEKKKKLKAAFDVQYPFVDLISCLCPCV